MTRAMLALAAFAALTACAPPVPDSGRGVGFQSYVDYSEYRYRRDAELAGVNQPITVKPPLQTAAQQPATPEPRTYVEASPANPPVRTVAATPVPARDTPVQVADAPVEVRTTTLASAPAAESPEALADETMVTLNNPSISDENNFEAVSNRQTIESDAERLQAQREAYQVIQPTAVPSRSSASGPNIVEFAISTRNGVGEKVYRRTSLGGSARFQRNCAKYTSPDMAQEDFLRNGGPQRDRMGLDPDGDGFACGWDPRPFRRISRSGG